MSNSVSITAAVACVTAILGVWWDIESKIESSIQKSTDLITKQIVRDATQLAELHVADLEVRKRILNREIAEYDRTDKQAPERLFILQEALISQIQETKEKTW